MGLPIAVWLSPPKLPRQSSGLCYRLSRFPQGDFTGCGNWDVPSVSRSQNLRLATDENVAAPVASLFNTPIDAPVPSFPRNTG